MEKKVLKKEDFLTGRKLAAEFGEKFETVQKALIRMFKKGSCLVANKQGHKVPMVTHDYHSTSYKLHPYAIEQFKEELAHQKEK